MIQIKVDLKSLDGGWVFCEKEMPPEGIFVLTLHKFNRIDIQRYNGERFLTPTNDYNIELNGKPSVKRSKEWQEWQSAYDKEVILCWKPFNLPLKAA